MNSKMVNLKHFDFISKMVQVALIDGARMLSLWKNSIKN